MLASEYESVNLGRVSSAALMLSGVAGVVMPERVASALQLTPASSRGIAEVRAGLGGTYAALGAWALVSRRRAAGVAVGAAWLGAATVRLVSLAIDRPHRRRVLGLSRGGGRLRHNRAGGRSRLTRSGGRCARPAMTEPPDVSTRAPGCLPLAATGALASRPQRSRNRPGERSPQRARAGKPTHYGSEPAPNPPATADPRSSGPAGASSPDRYFLIDPAPYRN
jgi:hypothetical protein